jgi:hypothetical protein
MEEVEGKAGQRKWSGRNALLIPEMLLHHPCPYPKRLRVGIKLVSLDKDVVALGRLYGKHQIHQSFILWLSFFLEKLTYG